MTPDGFWLSTPREFAAQVDGAKWRQEQERTGRWEVATLMRAKKIPPLNEFLDPPRTKPLTPEQVRERKSSFFAAKEASDRVPVRRPSPRE